MSEILGSLNELSFSTIAERLLDWGSNNMRQYPWRNTRDPYKILIAEIMLHRTKASQVSRIYSDFISKYPSSHSLAKACRDEIEDDLKSLGLRWRARLLHKMALKIVHDFDGKVPLNKSALLSLPGVGEYIASAVLCFAKNLPEPILDTNTVRVVGRVFNMNVSDSSRRDMHFRNIMMEILKYGNPRVLSFTLIDFAHHVCKPSEPRCDTCVLRDICKYSHNRVKK